MLDFDDDSVVGGDCLFSRLELSVEDDLLSACEGRPRCGSSLLASELLPLALTLALALALALAFARALEESLIDGLLRLLKLKCSFRNDGMAPVSCAQVRNFVARRRAAGVLCRPPPHRA